MTTQECFHPINSNQHEHLKVISSCCNAPEHKWFPMMCSDCGDFTDFLCTKCGELAYALDI